MELSATLRLPLTPKTSPSSLASTNSLYLNNNFSSTKSINTSFVLKRTTKTHKNGGGLNCRSMFGLGVPELAVIAGVTTLLFGPKMVPELGKSIGQTVKSFQQAAKEFESELRKESESATETMSEEPVMSKEQSDVKVPGSG